ncbi:glycine cleavage system P protein [Microdochium trichocladiopsis]|uniref:Glycine cleavage system P protein n=1 Tax=Microdochium trichocladiopsis TaxID=1682393 RepID=A0A9P8YG10_9PEZI|nr:glycine cleavage system P protein [Microdochium trichocladiopsis]KAH7037253.1 glycine cleavage system P protein [Microdochium trichocladiopsis]
MAASAKLAPRRLGLLAAQSRILPSSRTAPRLPLAAPLLRRQCLQSGLASSTGARRYAASTAAATARLVEDKEPGVRTYDTDLYGGLDTFVNRHIGPDEADTQAMLKALDPPVQDLDQFVRQVIPSDIFSTRELWTDRSDITWTETAFESKAGVILRHNRIMKSFIGQGYYGTKVPAVIQRNVLESPAWYTSYTPYQPEISQGRLESLVNFQTLVTDLTALPIANASLLDEGTAAAEAMTLSMNALSASRAKRPGKTYVVSATIHPQTFEVMQARAKGFGIKLVKLNLDGPDAHSTIRNLGDDLVGVMVQYPDTFGQVEDYKPLADLVHKQGALLSAATDLLALTVLTPPGEWGADIAFGTAQRLGVPMGYGGPHAAFFAVTDKHKRKIPGRLIGLSKDRLGGKAYRLALQTREQHIRREKATSNVCTAQALLANMNAFYAIYHGPQGLKQIAERIIATARVVQNVIEAAGFQTLRSKYGNGEVLFDTVVVNMGSEHAAKALDQALHTSFLEARKISSTSRGFSVDEVTSPSMLFSLCRAFAQVSKTGASEGALIELVQPALQQSIPAPQVPEAFTRTSSYLTHPVFNTHHSETELLRYIHHLQSKDLSLVHSMIPLGSCTMKLNGTTEMSLITRKKVSDLHPYTDESFTPGMQTILKWFKEQLASITSLPGVSLQPNSGAQGEFAGLRAIADYHASRGDVKRDICLIPVSAHGTNPASAAMAGMRVVPIKCDTKTGNLDLTDLEAKCEQYKDQLGAIMITYPSTYGVFEPGVKKACEIVHKFGGQVYMDGANMNAQIGLCSPGEIGADVCHLNLHKTFCIPHGGGGPGVGPICVQEHLTPFLPGNPNAITPGRPRTEAFPVSSANNGSASINLISWAYNSLMGKEGLRQATKITLLNANYIMSRLKPHYPILYVNEHQRCAHEFILDARPFRESAGIEVIDIAKRLQDYGFHAPTMSWPVANTLMIEPTESESKEELDRFIDALISIRQEIRDIEEGRTPREGNVLKNAPHPMSDLISGDDGKWERPYTREQAAYPLPWLKEKKFWPSVGRVDDSYGDLNLFCTCPPVEDTTVNV